MLVPAYDYRESIITEVQSLTHAYTNVRKCIPSGDSSLVYSAQCGTSPTIYQNSANDRSQIPKQRKKGKEKKNTFAPLVGTCLLPQ